MPNLEINIASLPVASPGLISGLLHLFESRGLSCDAGLDPAESAVAIDGLTATGMQEVELKWALAKGLVLELPSADRGGPTGDGRSPRYMLSNDGGEYLRSLAESVGLLALRLQAAAARPAPVSHAVGTAGADAGQATPSPQWLAERRELYFASSLVKRYRVPAGNQEIVLSVFEEEGWPYRIDDPLPGLTDRDPKRRLHETIRSLNRNQLNQELHFFSLGAGVSICWEPAAERAGRWQVAGGVSAGRREAAARVPHD